MKPQTITVIIADDHPMLLQGFKTMFSKFEQVKILATASNGNELIKAITEQPPQVVVTDIKMPMLNGIQATKEIKARFPGMKVLGLSGFDEQFLINDMMEAGADGYLLKNTSGEELVTAFNTVLAGEIYYCAGISQKRLNYLSQDALFTEREKQIMVMITQEKSSKEIADELFISTRTVEKHRHSLEKKIGTKSAVGIAVYATKNGFLGS